MGLVMLLLQKLGVVQPAEAVVTRFEERLIRTCQRERMLSKIDR